MLRKRSVLRGGKRSGGSPVADRMAEIRRRRRYRFQRQQRRLAYTAFYKGYRRADDAVIGYKAYRLHVEGDEAWLASPQQGTKWEKASLVAKTYDRSDATRAVPGIHACWGPHSPELGGYMVDGWWARVAAYSCSIDTDNGGESRDRPIRLGVQGFRAPEVWIERIYYPAGWNPPNKAALLDSLYRRYKIRAFERDYIPWHPHDK